MRLALFVALLLTLAAAAWADGFGAGGFVQTGGSSSAPPSGSACASVCLVLRII